MINKRLLAIIPARGGSKRLPRKNILDLDGKPLIAWTINSALKSKYIDRVVVSTDDEEIASISMKYGADVPFMRPSYIASDSVSSVEVIFHAVNFLENRNDHYDFIVLLQPTSPFRTEEHIDRAVELLMSTGCSAVISVCKVEHHPYWSNTLSDDLEMKDFIGSGIRNMRSQDLPNMYRLNGAIYLSKLSSLKEQKSFFSIPGTQAFIMRQVDSVDIDTQFDLDFSRFAAMGERA